MNKIYVVGIGPGEYEQMTIKAVKTLEMVDVIVGYSVYVDLVKEYFSDKEFYDTGMLGEVDRCKYAVDLAMSGKKVAVICSGDAGVYGMASLIHEVGEFVDLKIEVVAGVTSALSGSALLGAGLAHDFSVISLSDLLTPFDLIEKRVECASMSDMCIAFYNPSSKKRHDYLSLMCDIMLKHKAPNTVCGVAKNIGRENESYNLMTLEQLKNYPVDMFTTVFVGNSTTKIIKNKMVTPRGYRQMENKNNVFSQL